MNRQNGVQFQAFKLLASSLTEFCSQISETFSLEAIEKIEDSGKQQNNEWQRFKIFQVPPLYPEKTIEYPVYRYLQLLQSDLIQNNQIVKEAFQERMALKNVSGFDYLLLDVIDKGISIGDFLNGIKLMDGSFSPGMKFLYIFVLEFDKLVLINKPDKQLEKHVIELYSKLKVKEKLNVDIKIENQSCTNDEILFFILIQILKKLSLKGNKRISLQGVESSSYSLLESYSKNESLQNLIQSPQFWIQYYMIGQAAIANNPAIIIDTQDVYRDPLVKKCILKYSSDQYMLTKRAIISLSIYEVVQALHFLKFSDEKINFICFEISKKTETCKNLMYSVFRDCEESLYKYKSVPSIQKEKSQSIKNMNKNNIWSKIFDYLDLDQKIELLITSKQIYEANKKEYYRSVLLGHQIDLDKRTDIWFRFIDEVRSYILC